jgi:hypothetical protein
LTSTVTLGDSGLIRCSKISAHPACPLRGGVPEASMGCEKMMLLPMFRPGRSSVQTQAGAIFDGESLWPCGHPVGGTGRIQFESKFLMEYIAVIERNLGNIERLVRLAMGLAFLAWALGQPALNGIEWFVIGISVALILNGVFSRCYLWFVLDINTRDEALNGVPGSSIC